MNKYLMLGAIITLILIAFGSQFFYTAQKHYQSHFINKGVENCNDFSISVFKDICRAVQSQDPFMCASTGNFEIYCYESVFEKAKNLSFELCNNFSEYYPRGLCFTQLAKLTKNPSLCKKTGGMFQQCSWELAKALKRPELCNNIEVDCEKYQCLAEVMNNISICDLVPDVPERKICYTKLTENATIEGCKKYSPEVPTIQYLPDCIKYLAKRINNSTLCSLIKNKEIRWQCLASVSNSADICNSANDTFWKEYCLIEFRKSHSV